MRAKEVTESFNTVVRKTSSRTTPTGNIVTARIGDRDIVYMSHISTGFEDK